MRRCPATTLLLIAGVAALGGQAGIAAAQDQSATGQPGLYAVISDEVHSDGSYLRPSPDGDVVPDVDGNLAEDVMGCGFRDVRILNDPSVLHGSGFRLRLLESDMTATARACLQENLPAHARIIGPRTAAELTAEGL